MKRHFGIILLSLLPLLEVKAVIHSMGVYVIAGYQNLNGIYDKNLNGGGMTDFGVVYEFQYRHFLLQAGIGGNYTINFIRNNPYTGEFLGMLDSENDICTYHYALTDKQDYIHRLNIIPHIMFGGKWNLLYGLGGIKCSINGFGLARTNGNLTTFGEFDNLIVPLVAMDNHYFFTSYPLNNIISKKEMGYKSHFSLIGEIGFEIPNKQYKSLSALHLVHRLAFWLEYGLLSICEEQDALLIDFHIQNNKLSEIDFENISIQPFIFSSVQSQREIYPVSIGIKWTALLTFPEIKGCRCLSK